MASFNKVILLGNLTRDPELRYTPNGSPVCSFDLAVDRTYTTQDGERRDEVCYLTIVAWGKQAEVCAEYLAKGRAVLIEGHLRQDRWETPEGGKRSQVKVVAESVKFLGNGKAGGTTQQTPGTEDVPF